ncbi:MAG: hypothetical protein EXS13_11830 [Planctomycetes bacterium]|nr:hypothetical protein [Planctomycetota bacterium]
MLQRRTGDFDGAIATHRRILAIRERTQGRAHAETQKALYNIARCELDAKRFEAYERLAREVHDSRVATLGRDSVLTANAAALLARACFELGRPLEAGELWLEAHGTRRGALDELRGALEAAGPDGAEALRRADVALSAIDAAGR